MKSIALISIGLLGSAVTTAGVTGYLAWKSLSGAEIESGQTRASVTASATKSTPPQTQPVQSPQAASTQAVFTPTHSTSQPAFSQAENDFLYDLTQALQPVEHDRLSDAERLAIARQIAEWLQSEADYWSVQARFDALYQGEIAGDYVFNREVYIKFAGERLAPNDWIALAVLNNSKPAPLPNPPEEDFIAAPEPYDPSYEEPYEPPYEPPYEEPYEPPYEEPPIGIPAPYPVPPPYAQPPYPYPPNPYPPIARPPYPPHPDWNSDAYPAPMPPMPPHSRPPHSQPMPPADVPDWYQDPNSPAPPNPNPAPELSPDSDITEVSAPAIQPLE